MLPLYLLLFLSGSVFGSFVSAYSYRWPRGMSISKGRSICPKCEAKICWYDNIPLLSFFILNGKCRNCHKKISLRYPVIELSTGVLFVLTTLFLWGLENSNFFLTFYYLLITAILVSIFVIDLENKLIPDGASFLIFISAVFYLLITSPSNFYSIVFFAFFSASFFLLLHIATKGRGMGLGDVKLVLALALTFVHWKYLVLWLFLSFTLGAMIGIVLIAIGKARFGRQIPFGPFLIIAFFVTLFWGNILIKYLIPYI